MQLSKIVPVDSDASDQVKEFLNFLPSVLVHMIMEYHSPGYWFHTGSYKMESASYFLLDNEVVGIFWNKNNVIKNVETDELICNIEHGSGHIICEDSCIYYSLLPDIIICINYYTKKSTTLCIKDNCHKRCSYVITSDFRCVKNNIIYTALADFFNDVCLIEDAHVSNLSDPENHFLIKNISLCFDTVDKKFVVKNYDGKYASHDLHFCWTSCIKVSADGTIATVSQAGDHRWHIILLDKTKKILYAIAAHDNSLRVLYHDNDKIIYSEIGDRHNKIFIHKKLNADCHNEQIITPSKHDYLIPFSQNVLMNENILVFRDSFDYVHIYRS